VSNKKKSPTGDPQVRVRGVRRDPPDLRKLSRALIALALAQAQVEVEARADHETTKTEEDARRA
jgi:hypothetical protein